MHSSLSFNLGSSLCIYMASKIFLLETEPKTVNRKILETMYIHKLEPKLNDKEECISLKRFLIN